MIKRVHKKITASFYYGQWHVTVSVKRSDLGYAAGFATIGIHRSRDVAIQIAKDDLRRYLEHYGRDGGKIK